MTSDTLIVYNSFRNELYVGKPTAENLRRFLMIAPDGSSVTNLLLGLLSPPAAGDDSRVSNADGKSVSFTYDKGDTVESYAVDGKYLRTTNYEESIDGEAVLRIQYSDFTNIGNVYFPKSVSFEDVKRKISAKLFYEDIALRENDALEFTIPADAKEIFLN